MKALFFYFLLGSIIISCKDSEDDKTIADYEGLSVDLSWKNEIPKSNEGITLTVYDPSNTLIYSYFDSLMLLYHLPDGQYIVEVEVHADLVKTDYVIQVKGINSDMPYQFHNSFKPTDPIGYKKTSLYITKTKQKF